MTRTRDVDFWCFSSLSLNELFQRFRLAFPVDANEFVHDCENVWEWYEGQTSDRSLGFNICRPHEDLDEFGIETRPTPTAPIRFSICIQDAALTPHDIGARIATALALDIHEGEMKYLRGDDFEYRSTHIYSPE